MLKLQNLSEKEEYTIKKGVFTFSVVRLGKIVSVSISSGERQTAGSYYLNDVLTPTTTPAQPTQVFLSASDSAVAKQVEGLFEGKDFSYKVSSGTWCFGSVCFITN